MHYTIFFKDFIIRHRARAGDRQHTRAAIKAPLDVVVLRRTAVAGCRGLDRRLCRLRRCLVLLRLIFRCRRYRQQLYYHH